MMKVISSRCLYSVFGFVEVVFCSLYLGVFHIQGPQHWQLNKHCDCKISHNKQRTGKNTTFFVDAYTLTAYVTRYNAFYCFSLYVP